MAWDRISLDPEEAAATVKAWRCYADTLERHSADPGSMEEPPRSLGALRGDGQTITLQARQGAYELLALRARQHADRLEQTAQRLSVNTRPHSIPGDT